MIDEAGPWGTGPFTLVQGASSITTRNVVMSAEPYACSWLIESEQRDPLVVLEANLDHWNRARGPGVSRAAKPSGALRKPDPAPARPVPWPIPLRSPSLCRADPSEASATIFLGGQTHRSKPRQILVIPLSIQ